LVKALSGNASDIAPKFAPALIASQLASEKGGCITAVLNDEKVVLGAKFKAS